MKYTMETDDSKEFIQHYNGPILYHSIWEFQKYLRDQWKYNDPESKAWEQAAYTLGTILTDNGINMEEDYTDEKSTERGNKTH